jgi:hypothetical protein
MKRISAIRATPAIAEGIVGLLIGGGPLVDPATGHNDGWNAFMNNTATGATAATFHAYVICTPARSVTP